MSNNRYPWPLVLFCLLATAQCADPEMLQGKSPKHHSDIAINPLACAGPDQFSLRATQVTLDALCSRPAGALSPLQILWRQLGGTRVTLQSTIDPSAQFLAPFATDTLDLQLEVTEQSLSHVDSANIFVVEALGGPAPLALASGDVVVTGPALTLVADNSRALSGSIEAYHWRQVAGPVAHIANPDQATTQVVLPSENERFAFAIEVQDSQGLWSEPDLVFVHPIEAATSPPTLSMTAPRYVEPQTEVTINTSDRSTGEDTTLNYTLRQIRGEPLELDLSDPLAFTFQAPKRPQILVFRLDAEDSGVRSKPAIAVVYITAGIGNQAPIANAGTDRTVRTGQLVELNGSRSVDPDSSAPLQYHWTQSAGPQIELSCENTRCLFTAPDEACFIGVQLVVEDSRAASASDIVIITVDPSVDNISPIANSGGERWALPNTTITLDGSQSDDPDSGQIASFAWMQVDDGTPRAQLTHINQHQLQVTLPDASADLTFQVTVCDHDDACASDLAVVHVGPAGPYVDAALGTDDGNGTSLQPLRTIAQGLAQIQRFGIFQLKIAAGLYNETGALVIPTDTHIEGGLVREQDTYVPSATHTTTIAVPGADAVTVAAGATLENLTLEAAVAASAVPERRLIVMGPITRLINVTALGPTSADSSVTVDILEGSRVEIFSGTLRGGSAVSKSVTLRARPSSDVTVRSVAITVGSADSASGIKSSDGNLVLSGSSVEPATGLEARSITDVTGVELLRSSANVSATAIHLDSVATTATISQAVGLNCNRCNIKVDASSSVHGSTRIEEGGSSTGARLFHPAFADLGGQYLGGGNSSGASLTGMQIVGGVVSLGESDIRATSDGAAATAIGLSVESARVSATETSLRATANDVAIGLLLSNASGSRFQLESINASAIRGRGVVDGLATDLGTATPPSLDIMLEVGGQSAVIGTQDAVGIDFFRTQQATVNLGQFGTTAVSQSRGAQIVEAEKITLLDTRLQVLADESSGQAIALYCSAAADYLGALSVVRSRLKANASISFGVQSPSCNVSLAASVVFSEGLQGTALSGDKQISANGVYFASRGGGVATITLQPNAHLQLLNSIVEVTRADSAAIAAQNFEDLINLEYLLFVRTNGALLKVEDAVIATTAVELNALTPRFHDNLSTEDAHISDDGHLTSSNSLAIDNANPLTATLVDIDGESRLLDLGPDIGPDEY